MLGKSQYSFYKVKGSLINLLVFFEVKKHGDMED